jgi:hypothetical protein
VTSKSRRQAELLFESEDGVSMSLRNVGELPDYTLHYISEDSTAQISQATGFTEQCRTNWKEYVDSISFDVI